MITNHSSNVNPFLSYSSPASKLTNLNESQCLTDIMNQHIISGIESYIRMFSDKQKEVLKYLGVYFKKFNGNIQIPIKNLCARFDIKERWVHKLLATLRDNGWIVIVKRGGRKVTRRTFTERGVIVWKALTAGFGALKQVIPKACADYCADYSQGHTKYISSKVDILQSSDALQPPENEQKPRKEGLEHIKDCLKSIKEALGVKQNE